MPGFKPQLFSFPSGVIPPGLTCSDSDEGHSLGEVGESKSRALCPAEGLRWAPPMFPVTVIIACESALAWSPMETGQLHPCPTECWVQCHIMSPHHGDEDPGTHICPGPRLSRDEAGVPTAIQLTPEPPPNGIQCLSSKSSDSHLPQVPPPT